jgi:hypothetical protein
MPLLCGEGPARKRREAAGLHTRGSEDFLNLANESESRYSRLLGALEARGTEKATFDELNRRRPLRKC